MCDSRYCCSPSFGFARSWRQSKMRHSPRWVSSSVVETSVVLASKSRVQPLVEVHLGVLHGRLVGTLVVEPALVQGAPAAVEPLADLVVLDRRLDVRGL